MIQEIIAEITGCHPACGSSFFFAAAADAAETVLYSAETADAEMTAVCGSSCFSAAAADAAVHAAE